MPHPSPANNLDPALDALARRKWLALAVFCVACAAGVTFAVSLPDLYRATATVLVEREQVSEAFVTQPVTAELETRIQTIQQEVMSRARLADVIARFNLYPELRRRGVLEGAVERMRHDIRLELKGVEQAASGRNATIAFAISYSGRDPATIAAVANAVARLYIDGNSRLRKGQAIETVDFLSRQVAEAKAALDEQERHASEFKLNHLGELPQQVDVNLASLERLNTQLRLNGENQIRAMDRRDRLEAQLANLDAAPPAAPTPSSPESEQRARLEQELAALRTRLTEVHPEIVSLRAELDALERATPAPAAAVPGSRTADTRPRLKLAIADADAELRGLKEQEASLKQAVSAYEQRVENAPKLQEEFQALSRDLQTTKERYDALSKRYDEAQLAENLEQGRKLEQFRMLDPAVPPRVPSAPGRTRLMGLAVVLAIGLAVGAILAAERLNTSFHRVDDLRAAVGRRTVIAVPLVVTASQARLRRRRLAIGVLAFAVSLVAIVAGTRYVATGNEQFVRLTDRGRS